MLQVAERAALLTLLALVGMRPLITEQYDTAPSRFTRALETVEDPSPVRTLTFDLLILASAAVALGARTRRRAAYRWTGLEWGLAVLAVAGVASCVFAGQKRLAVNGTIDWLCLPVAVIALAQLLGDGLARRLLLALVIAGGALQAAQCFNQVYLEYPDVEAAYAADRDGFWARQGVPLDSPQVELFERRMRSREATGFFYHANVAASCMTLAGFVAVGASLVAWKRGRAGAAIGVGVLAMLMAGGVWLTGSRGALVAGVVALAAGGFWWVTRRWIAAHRRGAWWIGWGGVAAGTLAVVGHGLYHGTLPGASLRFRWQYWTASAEMIDEHPWLGVGRENFGRHYLQHKTVESSEEVSNAHNLFVQAACDWGVPGLVGLLLMMLGCTREIVLTGVRGADDGRAPPRPRAGEAAGLAQWGAYGAALYVAVVIGRLPLLGTEDGSYLYWVGMASSLVWIAAFGLASWAVWDADDTALAGRGQWAALGLLAFLVHDLINFAWFVPGSAMAFVAVLGFVLAPPEEAGRKRMAAEAGRSRVGAVLAGAMVLGAVAVMATGLVPVAAAQRHVVAAREAVVRGGASAGLAVQEYQAAIDADPLDSTAAAELAGWLLYRAQNESRDAALVDEALSAVRVALSRDPYSVRLWRARAEALVLRAREAGTRGDWVDAITAARCVTALHPSGPEGWVLLGEVLLEGAAAVGARSWIEEANESLSHVLEIADARPEWEVVPRLSARERARVEERIAEAERLLRETAEPE